MNSTALEKRLADFAVREKFRTQGPLAAALVITQRAQRSGLPMDPAALLTAGGGQVAGLGGDAAQKILEKYGVTRVLSKEGGRTSRGMIKKVQAYVGLLNELHAAKLADFNVIERFWIDRVQEFFAGRPFRLRVDSAHGLRAAVRDVIDQAQERRKQNPTVHYAGAVMQHLVGAKLDCVVEGSKIAHNSFSTADSPSRRAGDFLVGDVAIHVTASPSPALIAKCKSNLDDGLRPVIVTLEKGVSASELAADNAGIAARIDVFELEQFIALNLYELGKFDAAGRKLAVEELIERYNEIIGDNETDPSLAIELRK
jgi:Domain of unknown function (DUF4928)